MFEVKARLGGNVQRHRLDATTKTDAIAELRALQVDYARGESSRSPAAALTVAELAADWLAHLDARIGHSDPRRRYSARLRWRDVDLKAETLTIAGQLGAKGDLVPVKSAPSAARVPLFPALARELREHRARQAGRDLQRIHADALVFTSARGKPQSRRNALRGSTRLATPAGSTATDASRWGCMTCGTASSRSRSPRT